MKYIVGTLSLFVAGLGLAVSARGQTITRSSDTVQKKQTPPPVIKKKEPKPIRHEMSVGIRLNSDGWSAYTDYGMVKSKDSKHKDSYYNVGFLQLEVTEKKSPREQKATSENPSANGSATYIYGKINNFYAVKLAYGFRKMLAGKLDPPDGSVSIHWVNAGGLSLGLLKPYYLNSVDAPAPIKFTDAEVYFLDQSGIEGSAGFSKGLNQLTIIPGAHFKSALHFDFSANRKNVLGVETGFNVEYYSKAVAIMANQSPTSYFFDIFVAFQYGRRW